MKHIRMVLIALLCFAAPPGAFAQVPLNGPYEVSGQMLNLDNVYFNEVTPDNIGTQLDTGSATVKMYLTTCKMIPLQGTQTDSLFYPYPIVGYGHLEVKVSLLTVGVGTSTVVATLESSTDAIHWGTEVGASPITLVANDLALFVSGGWSFLKDDRFYRVKLTPDGTHQYAAFASYYLNKEYIYYRSQ